MRPAATSPVEAERCGFDFLLSLLLAIMAAILSGCVGEQPTTRAAFSNTTVNGHSVRLLLDTGANCTAVFKSEAKRLQLGHGKISQPVSITMGGQAFTAPIPLFRGPVDDADGLVGWPAVRNNILVFDPDKREIRRVEALPPETAGWLKFKVLPDRLLMFEVPLDGGGTGTLYVDTGAPSGVEIPARQWKAWRAAHSDTPLTTHWAEVESFGPFRFKVGWANEFEIGPLKLTDVAVANTGAAEGNFLQDAASGSKAVWVLGMYALMRMDMVVDATGGFAYFHPRPPPGPPYPGVRRPGDTNDPPTASASVKNWKVAQNVRLSGDDLYLVSGGLKWARGDFSGGLADFNAALEMNPDNADAHSRRGVALEIQGDYAAAVKEYEKVIELNPSDADYERLYRQTLLWRVGRAANTTTTDLVAGCQTGWPKILARFLTGKLDENALFEQAKTTHEEHAEETVPEQAALAFYYAGMMRLSKGDTKGARGYLKKCRGLLDPDDDEYLFAGAELKRLEAVAQK